MGGQISFAEFLSFLELSHKGSKSHQMKVLERKFVSAFKYLFEKMSKTYDELDAGAFVNAFESIDLNKDGRVSKEELRSFIVSKEEEVLLKVELDVFFAILDVDGSGFLDLSEIYEYLES